MQFNMQLSYVGNHGTRMGVGQNINLASALNLGSAGYPLNIAFGKTASVTEDFLGYSTNYSSLQAQLNRHFTGDLGVTTSFTWGKGLNYATGSDDDGGALSFGSIRATAMGRPTSTTNSTWRKASPLDSALRAAQEWLNSGSWLPPSWAAGSSPALFPPTPACQWTLPPAARTSTPPAEIRCRILIAASMPSTALEPETNGSTRLSFRSQRDAPAPWGPRAPWSTGRSIGNVSRNAYRGPGYIQNNASLFKTFALHENWTFEFRCDAFQAPPTRAQFASPASLLHQWNLWTGHEHGRQRYRDQRHRRRPATATRRYLRF